MHSNFDGRTPFCVTYRRSKERESEGRKEKIGRKEDEIDYILWCWCSAVERDHTLLYLDADESARESEKLLQGTHQQYIVRGTLYIVKVQGSST